MSEHWISVPAGGVKALLSELLALADDPHHVGYPGYGTEVSVPAYLAARWQRAHTEPEPPHPPPSTPRVKPVDPAQGARRRRNKDK